MSIHFRAAGGTIIVFGNTYPQRERIKALGGRYNGPDKNWRLPLSDDNLARVEELCRAVGGGPIASEQPTQEASKPRPTQGTETSGGEPARSLAADAAWTRTKLEEASPPIDALAAPGLSVSELIGRAAQAIQHAFPKSVWVVGEVQNVSQKSSGLYFDLAEGRSDGHQNATVTVRAIVWSRNKRDIAARHAPHAVFELLQDGMQLRCLCSIQLYRDRGSLSLVVEDIDPNFTKGALALARERLLKELRAKGLDKANKRCFMPPFPFRVGLISAAGSRAHSDFLDQLLQGGFPGEVIFCPTPMQGESVPGLVATALMRLAHAGCDVIVLTRGGGSAADLRWFDAPEIAYAIAGCTVPIVAAIGHHDDVCVAEEVCHLRQKTPTAAADCILEVFRQTKERIERLAQEGAAALDRKISQATELQSTLSERLALSSQAALTRRHEALVSRVNELDRNATARLSRLSQLLTLRAGTLSTATFQVLQRTEVGMTQAQAQLDAAAQRRISELDKFLLQTISRLGGQATQAVNQATMRLTELDGALGQFNPKPWMSKGWTQFSSQRGPVRRRADLQVGELVRARLHDAVVELRVERMEERKGSIE